MEADNLENTLQESILLQLILEVCSKNTALSSAIKQKVHKILAECDLAPYLSLHKLNTVDENTSNVLGIVKKWTTELTFSEQMELNQAFLQAIQEKLPSLIQELETLCSKSYSKNKENKTVLQEDFEREEKKRLLMESVDTKLNILKELETEKNNLMMEWLAFKMQDVIEYKSNVTDLYAAKTKTMDLKSKILHLQILHSIFTETSNSLQAYSELHRDLLETIRESEQRIQQYKDVIRND